MVNTRPRSTKSSTLCLVFAAAVAGVAGCSSGPTAEQRAFFDALCAMQGQTYEGRALYASTPDDPFLTERLVMHVESCDGGVIRVPFRVGDDRSRTWIITLGDEGMLLKHDHRDPDGTLHDLTDYGGWATRSGSAHAQSFEADDDTARMLPEASTNVWTMEIDRERNVFIYDLTRHAQPRFRAEFDLSRPIPNR
ncbi:MAG: hypothetical protein EA379_08720 [Phycisphaerales bacterium]|nr:MAG: hypothetical protein EA379_08720 [Phycisphaerales bacterium]